MRRVWRYHCLEMGEELTLSHESQLPSWPRGDNWKLFRSRLPHWPPFDNMEGHPSHSVGSSSAFEQQADNTPLETRECHHVRKLPSSISYYIKHNIYKLSLPICLTCSHLMGTSERWPHHHRHIECHTPTLVIANLSCFVMCWLTPILSHL